MGWAWARVLRLAAAVACPAWKGGESASSVGCRHFLLRPPFCRGNDLLLGMADNRSETERKKTTNPKTLEKRKKRKPKPESACKKHYSMVN